MFLVLLIKQATIYQYIFYTFFQIIMKYSFIHKIVVPNTILIVDDDEMNRDVLGNIFSASHSIEMAENGKECLNKILEYRQKFCAILLDVVMPVMGGIEVLKKLNRDGVVDHIPVFLITGETDTRSSSEHMNSA